MKVLIVFLLALTAVFGARLLTVEEPIENEYIVVFKEATTMEVRNQVKYQVLHSDDSNMITFEYFTVLNGFATKMTHKTLHELLQLDEIDYIEENGMAHAYQTEGCLSYTNPASWGLTRVSRNECGTGPGTLQPQIVPDSLGAGVNAYIIDTGVRASHNDFGGRVPTGSDDCFDAIGDGNGCNDCNGHGTHVASTVGGNAYGIAKGATLIAVRVLSCSGSGSFAGVVAGIDWSTDHCLASGRKCTSNLSLGGGANQATDDAVNNSNNAGVFVAVAAGNSNANSCNYSPARAVGAYTVGATQRAEANDPRASFSNYGSCMQIFAPGVSIVGAWYTSDSATNTISGTSMAAPHVCGAATALFGNHPDYTVDNMKNHLSSTGPTGCVTNPGTGSPNVSLYVTCPGSK